MSIRNNIANGLQIMIINRHFPNITIIPLNDTFRSPKTVRL